MSMPKWVTDNLRVAPGTKFHPKDHPTNWLPDHVREMRKKERKAAAADMMADNIVELQAAQELLYADDRYSLLVVLQAMDAAGKDSTIKHVMSGVNPQGCVVSSFKKPSAEELDHDFLWRFALRLPERGMIGIFNRSYYENVLVEKVHPEFVTASRVPDFTNNKAFWQRRYDAINNFEQHLVNSGTVVLKFFLNVSRAEQRARFMDRLDRPEKNWKFSANDMVERGYWDDYQQAFADAISATSTEAAPWYVIPADRKWAMRAAVSDIIVNSLNSLDMSYPQVTDDDRVRMAQARKELVAEEAAEKKG